MPKHTFLFVFFLTVLLAVATVVVLSNPPAPSPNSPAGSGCRVGGCSNELCLDSGSEDVASPCIYKEEWACYKSALCEVQSNGRCGWTQTVELRDCITSINKICGGFANLPCPSGYTCRLDGNYPDASGHCVQQ